MKRVFATIVQMHMLVMLLFCSSVSAAEITECWAFTNVFSENEIGFPTEHFTTIGFTANDPIGIIQSARAKRESDIEWIPLELNSNGSYEKLLTPAEGGQWEVQAINGSGESVSSCTTHILDKLIEMSFVQNVVLINNGSSIPTLCWDPVAEADYYKVRVMDQTFNLSYDVYLQPHITCHQLPEGILRSGEQVYLRIEARDTDDGHLENRSVQLIPYTPSRSMPWLSLLLDTGCKHNSDLNGDFIFGVNDINPDEDFYEGRYESFVHSVTFDGNGFGSIQELYPEQGDVENNALKYCIDSNGQITLNTVDGKHTLHGSASEDGNILMLIENYLPEVPTSDVSMVVGIKKSSGMSNSDLNGEYIIGVNDFNPDEDPGDIYESFVHVINFDGNNSGSIQELYPEQGDVETGFFTYSVDSDGQVTFSTVDGKHTLHGSVSEDENILMLIENDLPDPDSEVSMIIGIKKSSGMSNSDLNGEYMIGVKDINFDAIDNKYESFVLSVIFDGNNSGSIQELYPKRGTVENDPFTYSVDSDGQVTFSTSDGHTLHGAVTADGNILMLIENHFPLIPTSDMSMVVGIKKIN